MLTFTKLVALVWSTFITGLAIPSVKKSISFTSVPFPSDDDTYAYIVEFLFTLNAPVYGIHGSFAKFVLPLVNTL